VKSDFGSKVKIRVRKDYPRHRIQLKDGVAELALDIVGSSNLSVPSEIRLELAWRILRADEGIVSGGKVNWLIDGLCGEGLPTIDLTHVDLS
jgi:hypothetical protein